MNDHAAALCPLCGQANACARAAPDGAQAGCWCQDVVIEAQRLERIPPGERGRRCICPRCAGAAIGPPTQKTR